jgi:hypothetical protein
MNCPVCGRELSEGDIGIWCIDPDCKVVDDYLKYAVEKGIHTGGVMKTVRVFFDREGNKVDAEDDKASRMEELTINDDGEIIKSAFYFREEEVKATS